MKKRYTLATRDITFENLIFTCIFMIAMVIWACLTDERRLIFIPLLFFAVAFIAFIYLIFRYIMLPKVAVQADLNGIYLSYSKHKELYIDYKDITKITYWGVRNTYGGIVIYTNERQYKSIKIKEDKYNLTNRLVSLLNADDKEEYLMEIALSNK